MNSYSNVFGLEPNYPCCTVNHPQAYPKFLANSFVATDDGNLAHVFLTAGKVSTIVGGNPVTVIAETDYPFRHNIYYEITAELDFFFYIRIPAWANTSSTITKANSDEPPHPLSVTDHSLQEVRVPGNTTYAFTLNLESHVRMEEMVQGMVAIYYGPLLYSLAIDYEQMQTVPSSYDAPYGPLPANTTHVHTHDHILTPKSAWNVAVDPSQIQIGVRAAHSPKLESPIWALGRPPVELRVAAVQIEWPIEHDTAAVPPTSNYTVVSSPFSARFVPYGSAKVHMAHLPKIDLPKIKLI